MKLLSIVTLSTISLVGLYLGGYSWLYTQKVKEAQRETSIQTPKRLLRLLTSVIISSFIISGVSFLFLLLEVFTS